MFDIKAHDFSTAAADGYTFNLKLPTGVDSDAKLTVIGEYSPVVKAYGRKRFQEYQQRQLMAKRKGKDEEISLDEAEEMQVENALVRLVGWSGITEEGKEIKFSKEKAREVLTAHPWIRDQIISESNDVLNFSPKALKT